MAILRVRLFYIVIRRPPGRCPIYRRRSCVDKRRLEFLLKYVRIALKFILKYNTFALSSLPKL